MKKQAKTVLLVEDNRDLLEAVQILLEDADYTVLAVDNGDYVERLGKDNLPDIILLDMLLSGKDGRELARLLKSQEHTRNIPIILNSAHPQAKDMWKESGADDFVAKPFDIDTLLKAIQRNLHAIA